MSSKKPNSAPKPAPKPAPNAGQAPDTRTRILGAALELLSGGAAGVRMSDIAKAAGVSRQAVYLHFPARADLLIAAVRHLDELREVDRRLEESRQAKSGRARLAAFIAAWAGYLPEIHGVARALVAMYDTDEAARAAWDDRMAALRHGCAAAVAALASDGALNPALTEEDATDLLWTLLSHHNWERLTGDCGWAQERYVAAMQDLAARALAA